MWVSLHRALQMHHGNIFCSELHLHNITASFKKLLLCKYRAKCVLTLNNDARVLVTILNWQCHEHSMKRHCLQAPNKAVATVHCSQMQSHYSIVHSDQFCLYEDSTQKESVVHSKSSYTNVLMVRAGIRLVDLCPLKTDAPHVDTSR